jgi:uncharacterized membrane protein
MADTSKKSQDSEQSGWRDFVDSLPLDELKSNFTDFASAWSENALKGLGDKVNDFVENLGASGPMGKAAQKGMEKISEGDSPMKAGLSGAATGVKEQVKEVFTGGSGGGGGGGKKQKVTNIVESVDVGVPVSVAYNQWTQFQDWSDFMKKVEYVDQKSDEKISFKGQVFWSHRTWESTIIQQVPDEQIIWRSTGQKGYFDGGVTFHELAPNLTRILAVVEYYPQGFMEKTGNIWRAVGRRVQVEFKRYVRQVMTKTILDPDSVEGWRGEIRDSEVVRTHEEVVEEEQAQQEAEEQDESQQASSGEAEDQTTEGVDEEAGEEPLDEEDSEAAEEPVDEEPPVDEEEDPIDEEPLDEEPIDEEPVDEAEEEPVDEEPVDEEPLEEEPVDEGDEPIDEEPLEDEPIDEEPVDEAPVDEEEESVEEEPLEDEPVDEEPVDEEPIDEGDEPIDEEPADEEPEEDLETEAEAPAEEEEQPARSSRGRSSKSSSRSRGSKSSGGTKRSTRTRNTKTTSTPKNSSSNRSTRSSRATPKGKTQKRS